MFLLVALAAAHPAALPHPHAADPVGLGVLAFWLVAGAGFAWRASRSLRVAAEPVGPRPTA